MQNFDPKLYDTQNDARRAAAANDRSVARTEQSKEDERERKKFLPAESRKGKAEEENEAEQLPSAIGLVAPKKTKPVKEKTTGGEETAMEEASETEIKEAKGAIKSVDLLTKDPGSLPNLLSQELISSAGKESITGVARANSLQLEELLKLLVEKISIMKVDGTTETTLTLQNPPLFAGAKLTLTSYDMASGEFNITFSELRPDAKQLLDMNRQQLMDHLAEKGYVIHILVATTTKEDQHPTYTADAEKRERDNNKEKEREKEQQEQG